MPKVNNRERKYEIEDTWGLIREAMAFRVKYRLKDDLDKARAKKALDAHPAMRQPIQPWGELSEPNYGAEFVDQHLRPRLQ